MMAQGERLYEGAPLTPGEIVKHAFVGIAGAVYVMVAFAVFDGAFNSPGFKPNSGQVWALDTAGGALITFITAQLSITVAEGAGVRGLRAVMGSRVGLWMLLVVTSIFTIVGLIFLYLYVTPGAFAVPQGAPELTDAPEYCATHAKAFFGVVAGAVVAVGTAGTVRRRRRELTNSTN